jgi:regulatory protein
MSAAQGNGPKRKGGAPVTAEALDRAAAYYLERYASSAANLRRVLMRRVARAAANGLSDAAAGKRLVEELLARYAAAGLLDDRRYAGHKAASLARGGASRHRIRGKLLQQGVAGDEIAEAIAGLDDDSGMSELAAACALIRRRRLGPYRPVALRAKFRLKDLASLARAGFGFDLARRLLSAADPAALEILARGEDD